MFTIIPLIVIIVSIGFILLIASSHFKKAAAIKLEDIPQEREAALKRSILENRLLRKIDQLFKFSNQIFMPAYKLVWAWFNKWFQRIKSVEKSYRFYSGLPDSSKKSELRASQMTEEGTQELGRGNFSKAESRFLSAIKVKPEFKDAYIGLGTTYIKMNELGQAKETFDFVIKTWPQEDKAFALLAETEELKGNLNDAKDCLLHALSINNEIVEYHMDLAEVYMRLDEKDKALSSLQKAQNLEPNNPKILDQLFTVSIMLSNKNLASEVLEKIKIVNPDHGHLDEFEKKVKKLK